jgi:hypothetical protein
MPAVDVLNLENNEGNACHEDLSVAFVGECRRNTPILFLTTCHLASGDLRNVLLTVNSLPLDHTGKVTILINDREPIIAIRNLSLLSLLCDDSNVQRAADIALHVWYSAFVPLDYHVHLASSLTDILSSYNPNSAQDFKLDIELGPKSKLRGRLPPNAVFLLASLMGANYDTSDAHKEIQRVM